MVCLKMRPHNNHWNVSLTTRFVHTGPIPITLQFRSQGPSKEPAAGGFDETVWKPEEWCE